MSSMTGRGTRRLANWRTRSRIAIFSSVRRRIDRREHPREEHRLEPRRDLLRVTRVDAREDHDLPALPGEGLDEAAQLALRRFLASELVEVVDDQRRRRQDPLPELIELPGLEMPREPARELAPGDPVGLRGTAREHEAAGEVRLPAPFRTVDHERVQVGLLPAGHVPEGPHRELGPRRDQERLERLELGDIRRFLCLVFGRLALQGSDELGIDDELRAHGRSERIAREPRQERTVPLADPGADEVVGDADQQDPAPQRQQRARPNQTS